VALDSEKAQIMEPESRILESKILILDDDLAIGMMIEEFLLCKASSVVE